MSPSTSRKFTVLDAMVLIVAVAIGLALIRILLWDEGGVPSWSEGLFVDAYWLNEMFVPIAFTVSVALTLRRMRRPRPRLRRVFRLPGAACSMTVAIFIVSLLFILLGLLGPDYLDPRMRIDDRPGAAFFGLLAFSAFLLPGVLIVAVWMILWPNGCWRSEMSWVDRARRVLGIYFISNAGLSGLMYRSTTF